MGGVRGVLFGGLLVLVFGIVMGHGLPFGCRSVDVDGHGGVVSLGGLGKG